MPISALTKVGLAKEPSWGTSTSPTILLPTTPPTFSLPFEQILDQALRGIAAKDFAAYQGVGRTEGSLTGPAYPEELGFFFKGILGAESLVGVSAPYSHTFKLASTLPSFSIQDENGVQPYRYTGMLLGELGLSYSAAEGAVNYTTSFTGKTKENVVAAIPADATLSPFLGWMVYATINGVDACVIEGEWTFTREIALVYCGSVAEGGTQYPVKAYAGPLEITGRATLDFLADSDVDRYIDKWQGPFVIDFKYGTGAALKQLTITSTKMDFGEGPVEIDRSGVHLTLAYSMRALYNTTDAGQVEVVLKNARSTVY